MPESILLVMKSAFYQKQAAMTESRIPLIRVSLNLWPAKPAARVESLTKPIERAPLLRSPLTLLWMWTCSKF